MLHHTVHWCKRVFRIVAFQSNCSQRLVGYVGVWDRLAVEDAGVVWVEVAIELKCRFEWVWLSGGCWGGAGVTGIPFGGRGWATA